MPKPAHNNNNPPKFGSRERNGAILCWHHSHQTPDDLDNVFLKNNTLALNKNLAKRSRNQWAKLTSEDREAFRQEADDLQNSIGNLIELESALRATSQSRDHCLKKLKRTSKAANDFRGIKQTHADAQNAVFEGCDGTVLSNVQLWPQLQLVRLAMGSNVTSVVEHTSAFVISRFRENKQASNTKNAGFGAISRLLHDDSRLGARIMSECFQYLNLDKCGVTLHQLHILSACLAVTSSPKGGEGSGDKSFGVTPQRLLRVLFAADGTQPNAPRVTRCLRTGVLPEDAKTISLRRSLNQDFDAYQDTILDSVMQLQLSLALRQIMALDCTRGLIFDENKNMRKEMDFKHSSLLDPADMLSATQVVGKDGREKAMIQLHQIGIKLASDIARADAFVPHIDVRISAEMLFKTLQEWFAVPVDEATRALLELHFDDQHDSTGMFGLTDFCALTRRVRVTKEQFSALREQITNLVTTLVPAVDKQWRQVRNSSKVWECRQTGERTWVRPSTLTVTPDLYKDEESSNNPPGETDKHATRWATEDTQDTTRKGMQGEANDGKNNDCHNSNNSDGDDNTYGGKEGGIWLGAGDQHEHVDSDMAVTRETARILHERLEQANTDVQAYAEYVQGRFKCISIDGMNLTDLPLTLHSCLQVEVLWAPHNSLELFNSEDKNDRVEGQKHFWQLVVLNLAHNRLQKVPPQLNAMKQLQYLDLSNNNLTGLPTRSSELKTALRGLVTLNISNNQITSFPPNWCLAMKHIKRLILSNNQIRRLPLEIEALSLTLVELDVSTNRLEELADVIGQLFQLHTLGLSNNQLTAIPETCLSELVNLQHLELQRNQLVRLPEGLAGGERGCLDVLLVYNNQLRTLPNDFGAKFKHLSTLNAAHNGLVELPQDLMHLPNIQSLQLHHNMLVDMPIGFGSASTGTGLSNLHTLGLHYNNLAEIPTGFGSGLLSLRHLNLSENLFTNLPDSMSSLTNLGPNLCVSGNRFEGELRDVIERREYQSAEERKLVLSLRKVRDDVFPDMFRSVCARLRISKNPVLVQGVCLHQHVQTSNQRGTGRGGLPQGSTYVEHDSSAPTPVHRMALEHSLIELLMAIAKVENNQKISVESAACALLKQHTVVDFLINGFQMTTVEAKRVLAAAIEFAGEAKSGSTSGSAGTSTSTSVDVISFAQMIFTASSSEQAAYIGDAVARYLKARAKQNDKKRRNEKRLPESAGHANNKPISQLSNTKQAHFGSSSSSISSSGSERSEDKSSSRKRRPRVSSKEEQAHDEQLWIKVHKLRRSVCMLVELLPKGSVRNGFTDLIPEKVVMLNRGKQEEVDEFEKREPTSETDMWKSIRVRQDLRKEKHLLANLEKRLGIAVTMVGN